MLGSRSPGSKVKDLPVMYFTLNELEGVGWLLYCCVLRLGGTPPAADSDSRSLLRWGAAVAQDGGPKTRCGKIGVGFSLPGSSVPSIYCIFLKLFAWSSSKVPWEGVEPSRFFLPYESRWDDGARDADHSDLAFSDLARPSSWGSAAAAPMVSGSPSSPVSGSGGVFAWTWGSASADGAGPRAVP